MRFFGHTGLTLGDWTIAEDVSEGIELLAIAVIVVALVMGFVAAARVLGGSGLSGAVEMLKRVLGKGLLVGLDLLIAADIIRTVTLQPTLENVTALGVLVVVRTFLSWSIQVELEGHFPWQPAPEPPASVDTTT